MAVGGVTVDRVVRPRPSIVVVILLVMDQPIISARALKTL